MGSAPDALGLAVCGLERLRTGSELLIHGLVLTVSFVLSAAIGGAETARVNWVANPQSLLLS